MTEQDFRDNVSKATSFMRVAVGPELFFWQGYLRGLHLYYNSAEFETEDWFRSDDTGDDLESQGYKAGLAGNTVQEAMSKGKKGSHRAGLNGNFHKDGHLDKMGVIYHGAGKWTLPKGAKITRAPMGTFEPGTYLNVRDGDDWVLWLSDGSKWIVWSEDIPGISGPPWDP